MTRGITFLLGGGLTVVCVAALTEHATAWLAWLNVVAVLAAFTVTSVEGEEASPGFATGAPFALAAWLGALWIAGLAAHATTWLTWWTFAFACAFVALAVGGSATAQRTNRPRFA